ncbi:hypothetical protein [Lactococcus lactis]|uniref:Uncharacterized protein n=1 Tax=Lactococcus lactis TaxID=1358 RepID=A0AAW5TXG9_9LACT|nr:hypothetical protein [Lactococcus lactis]MCW2282213.1 hypothetical protein [Lactococcus lactis]
MMISKKRGFKFLIVGLFGLLLVFGISVSAKADTAYLTDSNGANLVSGNQYKIMFGWGSSTSKNAYLTGDDFHSSSDENNAGYYQIIRSDQQTGVQIPQGEGFIIRDVSTGQYWKYHSNMVTAYVSLDNSIIPNTHTLTTSDGSTFYVNGRYNANNGNGYYYQLGTGAYGFGYDWNNKISITNYYVTDMYFVS